MKLLSPWHGLCAHHTTMSHHYVQSHIHRMCVCLAGTCHLHFWQNGQDLLRATVETQGWNRFFFLKSQPRKLTLEKKILPVQVITGTPQWVPWLNLKQITGSLCRWLQVLQWMTLNLKQRSLGHCAGDYRYSSGWLNCAGDYRYSNGWLDSTWNRDHWVIVQVINGTPMGDLTWNRDHWVIVQVITGTPMGNLTQLKTEVTGSLCRWLQVLWGSGDNSVVRAPDLWLKGCVFESPQERWEFSSPGSTFCADSISVSVPPLCYRRST